jgi:predicted ester cyclase
MDDFVLSNLQESKNEWCSRLVSIFTPLVIEGVRSIFNESWKLCSDNDELGKYLMTFQNLLSRVPKWNQTIIEEERKRIIERSGCNYLEDLITCVHIIQLKVLTCIRVGNKQKKIDISIPKLDNFIHKVYIHVARKVYTNVYLFEKSISPLLTQRNSRELELIVQECILTTIRESIPTEEIIRAYMDESIEQEEEVIIENIVDEVENKDDATEIKPEEKKSESDETELPPVVPAIKNIDNEPVITRLSFNDYDSVQDAMSGDVSQINAPKTIERLEEISTSRAIQRKLEEEEEEGDINDRIRIHTDSINLDDLDIFDFDKKDKTSNVEVLLDDIEELA